MNHEKNLAFINQYWDQRILPTLFDYIKIPNKSPHFDENWQAHGHMMRATKLIANWAKQHAINGMNVEIVQLEHRTPVILIEIPGQNDDTVLLYGHLDKQPEMAGWSDGLSPWNPILRGDRLYGRGAADDGYAAFAALTAIIALKEQSVPHARCVILIEACEESGSYDLPFYIESLKTQIGEPSLIICLDSGCGNYEQLWVTTSLRGMIGGTLQISTLAHGVHSGSASGIAPSCFRLLRQLLNRIEDEKTGDILLKPLFVDIPDARRQQAQAAASILQSAIHTDLPFLENVTPESTSATELMLRRTFKPALTITGIDGVPAIKDAGNVTLPSLSVKLSMRLPPTANPESAAALLKSTLENDPPHHAHITFTMTENGAGWNAPEEEPWLKAATKEASQLYFGKAAAYTGEGGSIPFMGMLGKQFPNAQFLITGVLGPESNAHGPNEFLHLPTGKKLTACISSIIAEHYRQKMVSAHLG